MKRNVKQIARRIATFGLAAIMLAGCGNSAASGSNGGAESGDGATELTFMDVCPSAAREEYFISVFESFEKETGIHVTYESVPWDNAVDKLTVMGTSDELPDVMTLFSSWMGQFTSAGWAIPIDDYIAETRDEYNEYVQNVIFATEEEKFGALYTVPDGINTKGVYVRKDWAEEAGIDLSQYEDGWTYEEYWSLIEALTDPEQNHYGMAFRGGRNGIDPFLFYYETFNKGYAYSEDGVSILLNDDAAEKFEKFCSPYLKGYAPADSINWSYSEMVDNFVGGLCGTFWNDSEVAAILLEEMDESQWTVLPVPRSDVDGKMYNYANASYAYGISDDCENPDAAWQLIEYLSNPENNMQYCLMNGFVPVKSDVGDDPNYGEGGVYNIFVKELDDPDTVCPCSWGAFDYTDLSQGTFHEEMQKYLLGEKTAQQVMTELGEEVTERMQTYLKDNEGSTIETPKSVN